MELIHDILKQLMIPKFIEAAEQRKEKLQEVLGDRSSWTELHFPRVEMGRDNYYRNENDS